MVKKKAKGSCLCGSFKYEFNISTIISSHHCHCKDCQKSTGSGKATIIMVPAKELKKEGELKFFEVQGTDGSHVNRGFCPICGSPIISFVKEVSHINFIKAGSLEDASWVNIDSSFWNTSESAWSPVDNTKPSFKGNPE
ncbi:MAG: GFA family protein [SAR86 cluster bacterium]|nr:GFA family protein [SAR86 cluster bacterium]